MAFALAPVRSDNEISIELLSGFHTSSALRLLETPSV